MHRLSYGEAHGWVGGRRESLNSPGRHVGRLHGEMALDKLINRNVLGVGSGEEAFQTEGTVEEKVYKNNFFKWM